MLQVDLAFIMLSAGVYKFTAGYPRNHGMELGLCNPMWGYWWRWYAARRPDSAVFWTMNQLAWGTEVVAAVLMLIPPTRELGGLLLIVSFLFILTQIRLGFLCEMVMLCGLLYMVARRHASTDGLRRCIRPARAGTGAAASARRGGERASCASALWTYLVAAAVRARGAVLQLLRAPIAAARCCSALLERYTNLFGIIIWRVFSVDLVNFFIRVWREPRDGGARDARRAGSAPGRGSTTSAR